MWRWSRSFHGGDSEPVGTLSTWWACWTGPARGCWRPLLRVDRDRNFPLICQCPLRLVQPGSDDRGHDRSSGHLPEYVRPVRGPVHVVVIRGDGDYQVQQEELITLIFGDGPLASALSTWRSKSGSVLRLGHFRTLELLTFWVTLAS